jgi:hypothetical protein
MKVSVDTKFYDAKIPTKKYRYYLYIIACTFYLYLVVLYLSSAKSPRRQSKKRHNNPIVREKVEVYQT